MKPKEWLKANGHIDQIKRGRLSLAQIELCRVAAAEGAKIDGYVVSTNTAKVQTVTHTAVTNEKVIVDGFIRYAENEFQARETESGRMRSMRDACYCGLSLTGHLCNDPRIVAVDGKLGHVPITIERKA